MLFDVVVVVVVEFALLASAAAEMVGSEKEGGKFGGEARF